MSSAKWQPICLVLTLLTGKDLTINELLWYWIESNRIENTHDSTLQNVLENSI